jgi:hypothetical protein
MKRSSILLLAAALLSWCSLSAAETLNFEGFPDGTLLTNQYPNFTFSNVIILTSGISLNEFEFPPHSGVNVVSDNNGPMVIGFLTSVVSFGAYFTYAEPLALDAFDKLGNQVDSVLSPFGANLALSGDPGSSPNEFLQVKYTGGISSVTITGDPAGGSFVMDDATVVPEASTSRLVLLGFLLLCVFRFCRYVLPLKARKTAIWLLVFTSSLCPIFGFGQSVATPFAKPAILTAGASANITFGALITSSGAPVIPTGVNLLQVDQNGNNAKIVAVLNDNGTNGDVFAGDGIFGGIYTLPSPKQGQLYFEVSAAFKGVLRRVTSPIIAIPVVAPGFATTPRLMNISRTVTDPQSGVTAECDELVFTLNSGVSPSEAVSVASSAGGTYAGTIAALGLYQMTLPTCDLTSLYNARASLLANPLVSAADIDPVAATSQASLFISDPDFASQWSLTKIMAPQAFELAQSHSELHQGATIGVLDTGVNSNHQDLTVVPDINQCASVDANGQCTATGTNTSDTVGHGTAVAGLAAAQTNNSVGVASPAYAAVVVAEKIYPPGAIGLPPQSFATAIASGIADAIAKGARVINLSSSMTNLTTCPLAQTLAINYAANKGVLVVVSAGNNHNHQLTYPGALGSSAANLISVGATDTSDNIAVWPGCSEPGSSYGSWVNLYAPGSNMFLLQYDNNDGYNYGYGSGAGNSSCSAGTSYSAPLVAGAASMLLGMNPSLMPADLKNILTTEADPVGLDGDQDIVRRLNLYMAAKAVAAKRTPGDPLVPEASDTSFPPNYAVPQFTSPACVGAGCKPPCPSVEYRSFPTVTIANSTFNNTPNYVFTGYRYDTMNFQFAALDDTYVWLIPPYGFHVTIPQGQTRLIQFELFNGTWPISVQNSAGVQTVAGFLIGSQYCK